MEMPLLLIISGSSGVGKSTLAHKLLKMWKNPIILETFDLIREAIRAYEPNYIIDNNDDFKNILNSSSYDLQLNDFIQQCKILLPALKSISMRLQNKNIPAIIEGVNLDPITILTSNFSLDYFSLRENTIFINLHISNKAEYLQRLIDRLSCQKIACIEFDYSEKIFRRSVELYNRLEKFILQNPHYQNIYNIDISNRKITNVCIKPILREIVSLIYGNEDITFNGLDTFHASIN